MTLTTIGFEQDPKSVSEIGSMLFKRGVSGVRVITGKEVKSIEGYVFKGWTREYLHDCQTITYLSKLILGWGSHSPSMTEMPYLTAAASIGMTHKDIAQFIKRLDKVLAQKSKKIRKSTVAENPGNMHHNEQAPCKDSTGRKTPSNEVLGQKTAVTNNDHQGRKTPTSVDTQGRKTPTQVLESGHGRKTPTQTGLNNNSASPKSNPKLSSNAKLQSTDV